MPTFIYSGFTRAGLSRKGRIVAPDETSAHRDLARSGLTVMRLDVATNAVGKPRMPEKTQAVFLRDMALLTQAGVPLDVCLESLAGRRPPRSTAPVLEAVRQSVRAGRPLSASLAAASTMPDEIIQALRAGELAGKLPDALDGMAGLLESRLAARARIASALSYPAFVLVLALGSLSVIGSVLMPALVPLLVEGGRDPPLVFRIMIGLQEHGVAFSLALLVLVASVAAAWKGRARSAAFRLASDRLIRSLPVVGPFSTRVQLHRFLQTTGALLRAGVPLLPALEAGAARVSNADLASQLRKLTGSVESGVALDEALRDHGVADAVTCHLVGIGIRTGELGSALSRAAALMERRTSEATERLLALLGPLLTVFVAGVIGLMMMSVIGAIVSLNELVSP